MQARKRRPLASDRAIAFSYRALFFAGRLRKMGKSLNIVWSILTALMTLTTTAIMAAVLMTTHWEEITYSQSAVEALLSSENNVIQDVKFHDFLLQLSTLFLKPVIG